MSAADSDIENCHASSSLYLPHRLSLVFKTAFSRFSASEAVNIHVDNYELLMLACFFADTFV